jgi:outer membrane protein OmpA-like peptidoglycan-associated protein
MKKISAFLLCLITASGYAQDLKANDSTALVTFIVSDYDLVPEQGALVNLESEDKKISMKGEADIDGVFRVMLPEGKKYALNVQKFGETFDFGNLEVPRMPGPIKFEQRLRIRVIEQYVRNYTLEDVYFETGSYNLTEDSWTAIHKLHQAMQFNPKMKVEIAGHTDNVGDPKANLNLSQKRAEVIVNWLAGKGIAKDRLIAKGYGDKKPIADNASPDGRKKNRRTEIKVIEE